MGLMGCEWLRVDFPCFVEFLLLSHLDFELLKYVKKSHHQMINILLLFSRF